MDNMNLRQNNHQAIRLSQLSNDPPKEFKLWPFGIIKSTKGEFVFDKDAAKQVLDAYNEHGADVGFDYEHRSLDPQREEDHRSAGWGKVELRPDGLYMCNIAWTPKALEALKNKEYRYFSPAFDTDPPFDKPIKKGKKRRITRLVNIALTNNPATHGLTALVAASQRKGKKMDEEISVAPPESDEPEMGEEDVQQEEMDLHSMLNELLDLLDQGDLEQMQQLAPQIRAALDSDVQRDKKEGELPSDVELADDDALSPDDEDEKKKFAVMSDDEDEDDKKGFPALSCTPKAKLSQSKLAQSVAKLTGKIDEEEQIGSLIRLVEIAKSAEKLSQKSKQNAQSEKALLVEKAIRKGQLLPSKKAWALSQSVGVLKGYLSGIPSIKSSPIVQPTLGTSSKSTANIVKLSDGSIVHLSNDELKFAKMANLSKEAYATQKLEESKGGR
jgi:phage I-like protein